MKRFESSGWGQICNSGVLLLGFLCLAIAPEAEAQSYTTSMLADGFDFPVGKPDAENYYVFRGFSPGGHRGEDWNGNGGGDTDLGDPVYSIAHGVVVYSANFYKGWGNVVIVRHAYREKSGQIAFIDSLYGHLHYRSVQMGEKVSRGQKLGTIGKGPRGMYAAHLHFEIRKDLRVGMNRSMYPSDYSIYHSPRYFLNAHRTLRYESRQVRMPINTFQKSNPNRIETSPIDVPTPAETSGTVRPQVPDPVEKVIQEQTMPEETKPEKTKSFFDKLFGR